MDDILHPKKRHRRRDPSTSRDAAMQSVSASRESVEYAEQVMADGLPRIDEEIWQECRRRGFIGSLDAVEHGRRVLEITGLLVETGMKRKTSVGGMSREWVLHWWGHCPRCRRAGIEKKPGPPGIYAVIVCPGCGVVQHQIVYGQAYVEGAPPHASPVEGDLTRAARIARGG